MRRLLCLLALASCTDVSDTPDDTSPTDEPEPEVCDYADVAGGWVADLELDDGRTVHIELEVTALTQVDERAAVIFGVDDNGVRCDGELWCLARPQLDWHVVGVTAEPAGCAVGYRFFRLEDDGTLGFAGADSEFGTRTDPYFLERRE